MKNSPLILGAFKAEQIGNASGIFSLMRNVGGRPRHPDGIRPS